MLFGSYTLALVIITVIISMIAFRDSNLMDKLILWPVRMKSPKEFYRLLTSGFIHADTTHLFFNMFTLFFIGSTVEYEFRSEVGGIYFILLYLGGIIVASLPSLIKYKDNAYYRSLGASGGVAAVLFSSVYFSPWAKLMIWFVKMPSIVFAGLYLIYSMYMSRKGGDYINHDAHFWGAVFGMAFTFIIDPLHGQGFLQQLMHPTW